MKRNVAVVTFGLACVAVAASASHIAPVEATAPPDAAVPAAENVETVLRATYVLPADRGVALATFLSTNAAPGIDVRTERSGGGSSTISLTIIAPPAEQKALGTFIAKCVNEEPAPTMAPPTSPTLAPPFGPVQTNPNMVPNYDDSPAAAERRGRQEVSPFSGITPPQDIDFSAAPDDGFSPSPPKPPSPVQQRKS